MIVHKIKISIVFVLLFSILLITFLFLVKNTPGFKGDIDQELRIFLKQPVLLKSAQINDNKILDYFNKIYYGLDNKIFNKKKFNNIKIDIKFEELELLRKNRIEALKKKKLINPEKINVKITFEGNVYAAKARLKGDLSEHWGNNKQWSLRINLKGNKTIMSMNEFSLTVHSERDFPYNFLVYEITQRYNLLSPRYKTVTVNFNGSDWGVMLMEEQFSDSFYAKNKIKEAPIFKMTNEQDFILRSLLENKIKNLDDVIRWQGKFETSIYNERKIRNKSNFSNIQTNNTLISIFKNIQEVSILNEADHIKKIVNFQNVDEFAKNLAIKLFIGDAHSHKPNNARYYLNPYDLKIRPIYTDYIHAPLNIEAINEMSLFHKTMFDNLDFQRTYFKTIKNLEKSFNLIENDILDICKNFGRNCINMFDLNFLKKNIEILNVKKSIFKNKNKITNRKTYKKFDSTYPNKIDDIKLYFRAFDNGNIYLYNLTSEELKINKILFDSIKSDNNQNKLIKGIETIKPSNYQKIFLKKIKFNNNNYKNIKIYYTDETNKKYSINTVIENQKLEKNLFFNRDSFNTDFIKIIANRYIITKGIYDIKEPIVIPSGNNLIIEAGVTLKMMKDTFIEIQDGYLEVKGVEDMPIKIIPYNDNEKWSGIYVNSTNFNNESILNFVKIENSLQFNNGNIQLTGAINFIKSKVLIKNANILNLDAEDAINLVNSKIKINNSNFKNIKSDAIDIDFSTGSIENSSFKTIGGDAIDLSGSDITIKNIYAEKVFDKVISAGEESNVNIENLHSSNSGIVIASKDSSNVLGNNISAKKCNKFDFIVFQKKSYFRGGNMILKNSKSCNMSLAQTGSILNINNILIKEESYNLNKLYD